MVLLVSFLYVCDNLVVVFIESMLGIKENDSDAIKLLHLMSSLLGSELFAQWIG